MGSSPGEYAPAGVPRSLAGTALPFRYNQPGELERTEQFGAELLRLCVEVGGVLTGEHGVGVEKRDLMPAMFSEIDLNQQQRVKCAFDAKGLLATIGRCGVTTLCAPPTVWRLFIQERLADFKVSLREVCGAGEPLNPEVIDQVQTAWGLTIRDGYG